jgi:PAS domain S-box-containing protein
VPLLSGDSILGAVYIDSKSSAMTYGKEDLQFLLLVANTLASNVSIRRVLQNLRAEAEKLEAILESLKEGVLILDREFSILSTNTTAKSILGREDLVGMRLDEALEDLRHTFHAKALPGRACFQLETRSEGDGKAGASRNVYSATVSKNTANDQDGWQYVICFHDITQAQCLERMKAMLVNRLAHKLRTPLTVITGVNGLIDRPASTSTRSCGPPPAKRPAVGGMRRHDRAIRRVHVAQLEAGGLLQPLRELSPRGAAGLCHRGELGADHEDGLQGDEGVSPRDLFRPGR